VVTFQRGAGNTRELRGSDGIAAFGLGAANVTAGGKYIASNNVVLWGPFFGNERS